MNIAVWCAANPGANPAFMECAREVGTWIGQQGHTLVFGGSRPGLMGAVANSALAAGAPVIGITTRTGSIFAQRLEGLTQDLVAPTISERKTMMMDLADAYLVLPGGLGTFDELGDALALARCGAEAKRIGIYNVHGYYDALLTLFNRIIDEGFALREDFANVLVSSSFSALTRFITESSS